MEAIIEEWYLREFTFRLGHKKTPSELPKGVQYCKKQESYRDATCLAMFDFKLAALLE